MYTDHTHLRPEVVNVYLALRSGELVRGHNTVSFCFYLWEKLYPLIIKPH